MSLRTPKSSFWSAQEHRLTRGIHFAVARWYLRKPDLQELLEIKFPSLGSLGGAFVNELAYRLRRERTGRVLSLNVETTNFCNLSCTICPVNRGMVRQKRYLDPARFRALIDCTPGLRFILPFQWGEPLLHPQIAEMVRYATDRGIRSMLTTNGTLLGEERIQALLEAGLDRLTISVDGDAETHEQIRGVSLALVRDGVRELRARRDRGRFPLRIDVSMVLDDVTRPATETFRRAWAGLADRVQIIPRLAERPRTQACREAWRGSLVVLVDGTVTTCCADSEGKLSLGNAFEKSPAEILNDEPFRKLRRCHRRREFPEPCRSCSEYDGRDLGVNPRFE